jgi:hypothetical protein
MRGNRNKSNNHRRRGRPACLPLCNDYSPVSPQWSVYAQVRPLLHRGKYHGKKGRHTGLPLRPHPTVATPAIGTTVFVIIHNSIVETDNYPSLRNINLTTGNPQ